MAKPLHIVQILASPFPPEEGIGFYAWNLAKELTRKGHHVSIITRGGGGRTQRDLVAGISIIRATFLPLYPLHVHFHSLFVDRVIREMEDEIDLLHLHSPLVRYPDTKLPGLITFHTPMKADVGSFSITSWLALLAKLQLPFSILLENELIRKGQVLTVVAESVADELLAYGVDPDTISVLGNGVDTNIFSPDPEGPSRQEQRYFLTAGRLGPRKGLDDLLLAARILSEREPGLQFWIAGSGPYEGRLRSTVDDLGLNDVVRFLGHISDRQEMARLYRQAVGYIHAAHYEGLPTVLLEAMACGRPVVATAVSGALDVIEDGVNGFLTPIKDPVAMAARVEDLLSLPNRGVEMGLQAHRTIQQRYSWQVVAENYLKKYREICRGRS